jgi:hypothetical protein
VGQTGRTIEARLREHRRHVRLNQPKRSAVAEHSLTTYHRIDFDGVSKLRTATRYMDRLVREVIEIRLHHNNFNKDDGFNLSRTWCPIIIMLQLSRSAPMAKQGQAQVEDQPRPPVHGRGLYKRLRRTLPHIRTMMTVMFIETSVQYIHLTQLIAREDYIKFTRREWLKWLKSKTTD